MLLLFLLFLLLLVVYPHGCSTAEGLSTTTTGYRSYLVSGANKGQGLALCKRILSEHDDTHVFLCSRNEQLGVQAAQKYLSSYYSDKRVDVVQLDVTSEESVQSALQQVKKRLGGGDDDGAKKLDGLVSNAGILWGFPIDELMQVNCIGVKRLLDAFVPIVKDRVIVVSTGLSPLMLSYSQHSQTLLNADDSSSSSSWEEEISPMIEKCLNAEQTPAGYEEIGFPGGPFAESAPDFHRYGLSKMFADSYMLRLSKKYPNLKINSADPGLVYTDLILNMPRYEGKEIEDTGAKTPEEGVEVNMRLLFDDDDSIETGQFYAINKEGELKHGTIDKRPDV